MLKTLLKIVLLLVTFSAAHADPALYRFENDKSSVGFTFRIDGAPIKGTMPVASADISIDFDRLPASEIRININAAKARAGVFFATEAMRGKSVLDTANHPNIRFVSTKVLRTPQGAMVNGMITIRGITRPMSLSARFYRQAGNVPYDLSNLVILLSGAVSRAAFGATGYPKLVGDQIDLRIIAGIRRLK